MTKEDLWDGGRCSDVAPGDIRNALQRPRWACNSIGWLHHGRGCPGSLYKSDVTARNN
jgi:hypothetical protein